MALICHWRGGPERSGVGRCVRDGACGRKRPLGTEKSDDLGKHESTDRLRATKACLSVRL